MTSKIQTLKQIKERSDARDYQSKHNLARALIHEFPYEFYIDSQNKNIMGITHAPTNFRFHLPREFVPQGLSRERPGFDLFPKDAQWTIVPLKLVEILPKMHLIKTAEENAVEAQGTLPAVTSMLKAVQKPFGGPNPLLTMLAMGGTGGLAAYGGARTMRALLPESYKPRKSWDRLAAGLGFGAGALPALALYGAPNIYNHGLPGLWKSAGTELPSIWAEPAARAGIELPEFRIKSAFSAAGDWAPTIPVDVFNNVVIGDKYTPRPVRSATAGLTEATAYSQGSRFISPSDIAGTAVRMGINAGTGWLVGRTIGSLAGLDAPTQQKLKETGVWAGVLSTVVPKAFGY